MPDQIVRPKPRERPLKRRRVQHSLLLRALNRSPDPLLGREHPGKRMLARIQHRHEQRARVDAAILDCRQMPQQERRRDSARAYAEQVGVRTSRYIANDLERLVARPDVLVEAPTTMFGAGVPPAYVENLDSIGDRILGQA